MQIAKLINQSTAIQYKHPDSALTIANKALAIARKGKNNRNIAISLRSVGAVVYNAKMDYHKAKGYFMEALSYSASLPESDESLPKLYNCLGNCFLSEGDLESASHYYFKGLDLMDKYNSKDTGIYMLLYQNVSSVYGSLGKLDQSLFYFQKLITLATIRKDTVSIAESYFSVGIAYGNRNAAGDIDSAIKYFKKVVPLYQSIKRPRNMILVYNSIALALVLKNELVAARKYYDSAIAVDKEMAMANTQLVKGLGALEINAGHNERAVYYLNKGLALCKEKNARTDQADIYKFLAIAYSNLGDYQKAYKNQQNYALLSDSLRSDKMINAISQLEVKYRTSEKDKELTKKRLQLALAESRLNKDRSKYIGFFAGSIILIIAMIAIFQKQRLQLHKVKSIQQRQKMDQLKAAIDSEEKEKSRIGRQLHDDIMVELSIVKMGLSALPMDHPEIKHTNNYKNLVEQLDNTSRKLRQTAHNLMPDVLLEEGLVPAVSYFCNNIKKMTGLYVRFQYYGTIPRMQTDKEVNVYRIIQELLQNIIKHANAKYVLVQLNYYEKILSITVEDDGVGFDINQIASGAAMGLKSIQTRIKAIDGNIEFYPRTPHGTSVNISLQA